MFVLLLMIPLILGCGIVKEEKEMFGITTTKSLKGFFAVGVVLHHLCTYFYPPIVSLAAYKNLGFIMVSGFFVISGYGLTLSAERKSDYTKHFLWKRVIPIVVTYYISAVMYAVLFRCNHMLDFTKLKSLALGDGYWFIWAIVVLYIGFWISFRFFKRKSRLIISTVWVFAYMSVMYLRIRMGCESSGFWWFNSAPAFLCGMYFAVYKDKLTGYLKKGIAIKLIFIVFAAVFIIVNMFTNSTSELLLCFQLISSTSFSMFVIAVSLRFKFDNFILIKLGGISLELYLVQALWIAVIGSDYITLREAFLRVTAIIAATIISAYAVHFAAGGVVWLLNKIHGLFIKPAEKKTVFR